MVEKHVHMEDNLMGYEDYKLVDGFFHKEDKVFVFLEDVSPQGITDFPEKERAKDLVSHSIHTTGYGLQFEIAP